MLEHVALNQTSFKLPGVAPDARGVLLGKQGAVLLPSFDRLVAFLRVLSQESPLDDVLPSLKLYEVRTRLLGREHLALLSAQSSYLLDRCARAAALSGAQLFTGSGKHFVKYRDRRSPLGYDVDAIVSEPADFILYADSFTQGYTRERELSFSRLLLELELRPVPGGAEADLRAQGPGEVLWLTARRGLADKVLGYLWRNRCKASAAQLLPELGGGEPQLLAAAPPDAALIRVEDLPPRLLRQLLHVPGVTGYAPVLDGAVVELGFRHPLRLSSCGSALKKDHFYLFSGPRDGARGRCQVLASPPPLLPLEALLQAELAPPADAAAARPAPLLPAQVPLRLVRGAAGRRLVKAALVPYAQAAWLKQLVYALPPTLLGEYQVSAIDEGLFVLSPRGIDVLPIGALFQEAAPSIFVPVGLELVPRVDPQVLAAHLGGATGRYLVLLPSGAPPCAPRVLSLAHGDFDALGRKALAPLPVAPRQRLAVLPRPERDRESTLVNDPAGALPLSGFRGASGSGDDDEGGGTKGRLPGGGA